MTRVGWLDLSAGVAGDMLLGALTDLRALDPTELPDRLRVEAVISVQEVTRGGLRACQVVVEAPDGEEHRHLADVVNLLARADLPTHVAERAAATFGRLATAEAAVHGVSPDQVAFHEVGAVNAIVDIAGTCLGLDALGLGHLVTAPVALGGGVARSAHGPLAVPGPAVLALLAGSPLVASSDPQAPEQATPTGLALVSEWSDAAGGMPPMTVEATGVGAGGRDPQGRPPNTVRLVVGTAAASTSPVAGPVVVEANVDDLDPRLWPGVLDRLLACGASDAWLTPIVMKKGRPAHTVSVLTGPESLAAVRRVLVTETTTIGMREHAVTKHALDREETTVEVLGHPVRVKVARDSNGRVVNRNPEFADVAAVAAATGRPVKDVLAAAIAAAQS